MHNGAIKIKVLRLKGKRAIQNRNLAEGLFNGSSELYIL